MDWRVYRNVWNYRECEKFIAKKHATSNGQDLDDVDVKRGILQGGSLYPLLFTVSVILLTSPSESSCLLWIRKERMQIELSSLHWRSQGVGVEWETGRFT